MFFKGEASRKWAPRRGGSTNDVSRTRNEILKSLQEISFFVKLIKKKKNSARKICSYMIRQKKASKMKGFL